MKIEYNEELNQFVADATKRGMTYGQLQQEETIGILRKMGFWKKDYQGQEMPKAKRKKRSRKS